MRKILANTWKFWREVPGNPPLWKCLLVSVAISRYSMEPKNKIGSIVIEEMVDSENEETGNARI
jgi:hypothetical protein